jgi:hypothetical protein
MSVKDQPSRPEKPTVLSTHSFTDKASNPGFAIETDTIGANTIGSNTILSTNGVNLDLGVSSAKNGLGDNVLPLPLTSHRLLQLQDRPSGKTLPSTIRPLTIPLLVDVVKHF